MFVPSAAQRQLLEHHADGVGRALAGVRARKRVVAKLAGEQGTDFIQSLAHRVEVVGLNARDQVLVTRPQAFRADGLHG